MCNIPSNNLTYISKVFYEGFIDKLNDLPAISSPEITPSLDRFCETTFNIR